MSQSFWFQLISRWLGSRTSRLRLSRIGNSLSSGVTVVQNCDHITGGFIQHFQNVCNFFLMVSSFCIALTRQSVMSLSFIVCFSRFSKRSLMRSSDVDEYCVFYRTNKLGNFLLASGTVTLNRQIRLRTSFRVISLYSSGMMDVKGSTGSYRICRLKTTDGAMLNNELLSLDRSFRLSLLVYKGKLYTLCVCVPYRLSLIHI